MLHNIQEDEILPFLHFTLEDLLNNRNRYPSKLKRLHETSWKKKNDYFAESRQHLGKMHRNKVPKLNVLGGLNSNKNIFMLTLKLDNQFKRDQHLRDPVTKSEIN